MQDWKTRQAYRPRYVLEVSELNDKSVSATHVLDISPHGAQLETNTPLAEGEPVKFSICLAQSDLEEDKMLYFQGQVVWIRKIKSDPALYRLGITFPAPYSRAVYKTLETFKWKFF
jgi:hypothetical protein